MRNIRGAIFDMDGTLLDSMPIYDTAISDMMRSLGYSPREDLYEAVRPLSGNEVLEYLRGEYGVTHTLDELNDALDRELFDYYNTTPPMKPGVLALLDKLRAENIPMCVATATNRVHVEAALNRLGIAGYFTRIFTCAEEETGKREPKIFLKAAEHLGFAPTDVYVFEDAVHAIHTAKNAGFRVVAVRDLAEDKNRAEIISVADEFYDDLSDFVW